MPSDVVSRLTDSSKYTGAHKERFDAEGGGKGKAGRESLVNNTGSTSSASRNNEVSSSTIEKKKSPTVKGEMGKAKFGVQTTAAPSIILFRNGDKFDKGTKIPSGKMAKIKTLDQLKKEASNSVKLTTGPCIKIYKKDLKTLIKDISELEEGGMYLCCGGEKPIMGSLPAPLKA